jgi:hypothetical protein
MQKLTKEQQQVAVLAAVLVVIVAVLGWYYRDKFLPHPSGEAALLAPPARLTIPRANGDDLYGRDEFKGLKRFADVPVRALQTEGSPEPFITDTKQVP